MQQFSEAQLVQDVLRGDSAALGTLLQMHQKRLYNVALRMVSNRDDAAEITQDGMVKIIEHVADFKCQSSIGTWMVRIIMNLSISHLRKRKLRTTASLDQPPGAPGTPGSMGAYPGGGGTGQEDQSSALRREMADHREPSPAVSVQQREMHLLLQKALAALEEDFRSVIVLRDINEMDYQQIAQVLAVPVGTVKSRLFRARLALRQQMFVLCPPPTPGTPAPGISPGTTAGQKGGVHG